MTVVIGTAGHIDHGKTTLLRALTGIDADRLPEEKRRGLTIDVGYAHGAPDDGPEIDYVDVPGHDRLVGNMLVGAGEIDACLLVVAADDGPRAQTWEHLGLLDAMGIERGLVAITKCDLVETRRTDEVSVMMRAAADRSRLAGAPIVHVSATTGQGMAELRRALAALRDEVASQLGGWRHRDAWVAIDRVFTIRGRGVVITGSSRGRPIERGADLHVLPGDVRLRVRGIQVHDAEVAGGPLGGRVALNVVGAPLAALRRGLVLADMPSGADPLAIAATDRVLVALDRPLALLGARAGQRWPPRDGSEARLHIGTEQATAFVARSGRDALALPDGRSVAMLRLDRPVATAIGERFVLRRPSPAGLLAGGVVLDADPPRGRSRRRQSATILERLDKGVSARDQEVASAALLDMHGFLRVAGEPRVAADVRAVAIDSILAGVGSHHGEHRAEPGLPITVLRARVAAALRGVASIERSEASSLASSLIDALVAEGRLARHGEHVRMPEFRPAAADPALGEAMDRLVTMLDATTPPSLAAAAEQAGCPADAPRDLERQGRIVIVDDDLAWSARTWTRLRDQALGLARIEPLTPAALRDATGSSRKYVMALLEDLDRRGLLRRTPAGHVPGPRAAA